MIKFEVGDVVVSSDANGEFKATIMAVDFEHKTAFAVRKLKNFGRFRGYNLNAETGEGAVGSNKTWELYNGSNFSNRD